MVPVIKYISVVDLKAHDALHTMLCSTVLSQTTKQSPHPNDLQLTDHLAGKTNKTWQTRHNSDGESSMCASAPFDHIWLGREIELWFISPKTAKLPSKLIQAIAT